MNWEHVRAFLWLQTRIRRNKSKRSGELSRVLHALAVAVAIAIAISAFLVLFAVGHFLKTQPPKVLLLVWDAAIGLFLLAWVMILSVDLQRSELLPLEKFMHYPISISGLFLINYIASVLGEHVAMCFFFPAMLGLATGLVFSKGAAMLWLFPLVAVFILMVTAVTYQFRGWLAVLMMNKRHRRTIVTVVTFATMLIFQIPYLSGRLFGVRRVSSTISHLSNPEDLVRNISMVVPLGWVGYGAMGAAEGRLLPPLLGIAGMSLISALSLRRSYRTTIRLYTGNYGYGKTKVRSVSPVPMPAATKVLPSAKGSVLEWKLPWISEQTAAVALANLRSITRAPEAKMMLISPVILILFFGASVSRWSAHPSEFTRPLVATGVLMMLFLSLSGMWLNQFGFDRSAFRNYVLSAASRRDILFGKNLANAPMILGLALAAMGILEWIFPMQPGHFIGVLFQTGTMFLLMSLFANFVSIFNPHAITSGSMRPAVRPSGKSILFGMLLLLLYPFVMAPSMIPLGLEFTLHRLDWHPGVPVFFILSAVEFAAAVALYGWVLAYQGKLLQSREISILEVVTAKAAED